MNTGISACAIATAKPASAQPANSGATPPAPRSAAATAVSSAQATSSRSIDTRRESRGASGAKAPKPSTGSVVSRPPARPDRPRSSRMLSSSGGRLATSVRRFSASSTIARHDAEHRARGGVARPLPGDGVRGPAHRGRPRGAPRTIRGRPQVGLDPRRGGQQRRDQASPRRLDRHPARVRGQVHGRHDRASAVADRGGDGAQALLELLVHERPALAAHLRQLGAQRVASR